MAKYDVPAMIDYVLYKTGQPSLYYVGHSQGALVMLAKLSKEPGFSTKIRKFFALAPASRTHHAKGRLTRIDKKTYERFRYDYKLYGDREVLSRNAFISALTDVVCDRYVNEVCEKLVFSIIGPNSCQFNASRIGIYLAHHQSGTSSRNMLHFAQLVYTKRLGSFDRGEEENIRCYGTPTPPEYNFSNVYSDIYIFYSNEDWVVTAEDVEEFLIPSLPRTSVKLARKLYGFNHNEIVWGLRAREEIYDPISNIIRADLALRGC
ncbi:hypothetical protein OESDEN_08867 [Oesophagostomum dentatum]|uniref:AB hydrolase-1 domain-containing protein n=1 Tax=Oesophagostomum dentatum TaxID=61180 RepID=A0A0B1T560_OESDE|nr:hypothetical protein OESDEN_08867 [Oesophagostomum dentatum]